jgi:nifR3 family TIM-barrel protein
MNTKENAIQIRNLRINPPLLLAPMAGLTHSALRQTISGFGGVGLLSTEMLSAKRLPTENKEISPFLIATPYERPLSYQLLISKEEEAAPAIERLHELQADAIDLNLGCPAPAVRRFGAGSKLAEQPDTVRRIVSAARKRTDLPLTAKIRLGEELNEQNLKAFCTMLEGEGIDMLSVHARLKKEPFIRKPKWQWCAKIKQWLTIPVIANGGIFSVQDAEKCLQVSGADGLMIGRGAAVRPWLLAETARKVFGFDIEEREISLPEIYINFIDLLNTHFPPERRLGRLKEFTHYFSQNFKFGHHLAYKVQTSKSIDEAQERAELFFLSSG